MLDVLIEPLNYEYMRNALFASALIGCVCAFLSAFLVLKGWSLIGDALSHSVVPGVAGAYALGLPFSIGAFFAGFLASMSIAVIRKLSSLREDAIIGFVFTTFFAAGMLIISLNPTSININAVILGNILIISQYDLYQIVGICLVSLILLLLFWKDLALVFFDENQAKISGLKVQTLKVLFFSVLSACVVASLQAVGAILVIAMVITPGATAYLLTDRFSKMLVLACAIGVFSSLIGTYLSYFVDGVTGGLIVLTQTAVFAIALICSPKYGLIKGNKLTKPALGDKANSHLPENSLEQKL
ncbi:metal ABC transporter permease [Reinekea thalattae]|uniref:Metal ABC transporter permease n=1 Tax=Reinekea thalattae TaxID=2593301 RepID=A0A5C8ZCC0_9GAMM|nr:metal ABC transporter permease [Reinekea thalattae]TXR54813.1 metal ABC transporter permease [Reinekea thalattae]